MKICFWGDITNALNGKTPGGGELQTALLAKSLALSGNEVVIIDPGGAADFITPEGIKVISVKGWNNGTKILRTLTHRFPQLFRLLKEQNADVYYCRLRDFRHILAYWAARKVKAKFILALASDIDILSFWKRYKHIYSTKKIDLWLFSSTILVEIIFPFLVRKSDIIFAQHKGQKEVLDKKHINSLLNPNLIDLTQIPVVENPIRKEFVIVGSISKRKGIIKLFELVTKCPQLMFKVIGQPRDKTGHFFYEKLKYLENVTLFGRLDHLETIKQIANSSALISTSEVEGFPNVFIESWACGIPVISLFFNPGNIIEEENLGYFANGNMDNLVQMLNYFASPTIDDVNCKRYVNETHVLNSKKIGEINTIFEDLIKSKKIDAR